MGSEYAHRCAQNAENCLGLFFSEQNHKDGDKFLRHNVRVTGDETWVSYVNVESKEQSKQWTHTHSPNKPRNFKQKLPARKLMTAVLWDRKGVLMVEFCNKGPQ
jgi:hypothetical protein